MGDGIYVAKAGKARSRYSTSQFMSSFHPPRKTILTPAQLVEFQGTETYTSLLEYINTLNDAVVGVKLTDDCTQSEVRWSPLRVLNSSLTSPPQGVLAIIRVLDRVEELAKETPAVHNAASRFGNPAFKTLYDKISNVGWHALL